MDPKEQIIFNLKREIQLLKLENQFLKDTVHELNGGAQIQMPNQLQYTPFKASIDYSEGQFQ